MDDKHVSKGLKKWVTENPGDNLTEALVSLQQLYDDEDDYSAYMFSEDDWTERLTTSLSHHNHFTWFKATRFPTLKQEQVLDYHVILWLLFVSRCSGYFILIKQGLREPDTPDMQTEPNTVEVVGEVAMGDLHKKFPYLKLGELR